MVAGERAQQFRALAVHAQHQDVTPSPSLEIFNRLLSPVAGDLMPSSDLSGHQAHAYKENTHMLNKIGTFKINVRRPVR